VFIVSVLPATIQALFILGVPVLPKIGMRPDGAMLFVTTVELTDRNNRNFELLGQKL
jgi:hypothetical protein